MTKFGAYKELLRFAKKMLSEEGIDDPAGATSKGIAWATWRRLVGNAEAHFREFVGAEEVQRLTDEEAFRLGPEASVEEVSAAVRGRIAREHPPIAHLVGARGEGA